MDKLREAIDEVVKQSRFLRVLKHAGEFSPVAHFIKEYNGPGKPFTMVWISHRYEEIWGKSKAEYEGQLDTAVWSQETADEFMRNDHQCLYGRVPLWTIEDADGIPCLVCKYPIFRDDYNFRGLAGIAIPVEELSHLLGKMGES